MPTVIEGTDNYVLIVAHLFLSLLNANGTLQWDEGKHLISYAAGLRLNKKDSLGDPIDAQAAEVECQVGGGGGVLRFFILA